MSSGDRNAADTRARLDRDGVTAIGYLTLAAWAWFLYGFGALLPQLGREQGISRAETALHSVGLAVGALIAGSLAVPLVRRYRRRGVLRLGCLLVMTGVVVIAAGGGITAVTVAASVLAGTGGSIVVNTAISSLAANHQQHSAAALSEGNALATGLGLVAPLAVGAGLALGLTWRPAVLFTVPLMLLVLWLVQRQPPQSPVMDEQLPPRSADRTRLPVVFWVSLVILVCCTGIEFSMSTWTAQLLQDRAGMSSGGAAAGVSALLAGMTVGRLATGRLALRHNPYRLLTGALLITAAGWLLAWSATSPGLALTGLLITGTGLGAQYPVGASVVIGMAGGRRDKATGMMSIGVGLSIGVAPFALGALADATSTHTAFLVVPGLIAAALILVPISARMGRARANALLDGPLTGGVIPG